MASYGAQRATCQIIHSIIHLGRGAYWSNIHWSIVDDRVRLPWPKYILQRKRKEKDDCHATVNIAIPERTYLYFLSICYIFFLVLSNFRFHRSRIDLCLPVFGLFPNVFFFFFWLMTNFEWFFLSFLYLITLYSSLVAAVQWKLQIVFVSFEFGLFFCPCLTDNANHSSFGRDSSTRKCKKNSTWRATNSLEFRSDFCALRVLAIIHVLRWHMFRECWCAILEYEWVMTFDESKVQHNWKNFIPVYSFQAGAEENYSAFVLKAKWHRHSKGLNSCWP